MSRNRSFIKTRFSIVVAVLATLSLGAGFVPSASAQVAPASSMAIQFFDAVGGNASLLLVSPDAVLHTPEGDYAGRAGLNQFGDDLGASFSNVAFSTQSAAQAGNLVIVSFTLTGINTSSYQGIAANCAGIAVPGVAVLKVSEEQVAIEHFQMGPDLQQIAVTQVDTRTLVTEQWIDYDRDVIASQLSAFNQIDSNTRPGCADHVLPQAVSTYEPPLSCLAANLCSLPW